MIFKSKDSEYILDMRKIITVKENIVGGQHGSYECPGVQSYPDYAILPVGSCVSDARNIAMTWASS